VPAYLNDEFYEAWQVRNGAIFQGNTNALGGIDQYSILLVPGVGTTGTFRVTGYVRFVLDDEIFYNPSDWNDTAVGTGPLQVTRDRPKGWTDGGDAKPHHMTVSWDCTGPEGNVQSISTTPQW
jgi:hypothetical protein